MVITKKKFSEMVIDATNYLTNQTDITYLGPGSVARSLVESTCLEIARLQNYVTTLHENSFISTAGGYYLDLFGEMLGMPRINYTTAESPVQDKNVRFYVETGTLGSKLPNPTDPRTGLIPRGTIISARTNGVRFEVTEDTVFPVNAASAYVSVQATARGSAGNIGANQLTIHNLGSQEVRVTNDFSIASGNDVESDEQYRYRLSQAFSTRLGGTASAVELAASSQAGVSYAELIPYARGGGTFDIVLVPTGNKVSYATISATERAVRQVTPLGVNFKVKQPKYMRFKITIQLKFAEQVIEGRRISIRAAAENAILNYLGNIPLGGEIILNRIRAAVLNTSSEIRDIKIHEICLNGRPRILRNMRLMEDHLVIPDDQDPDPIQVV